MRKRVWVLALLLAASGVAHAAREGFERMRFQDWRLMIKEAHLAFERGNKERAFELYTRNACAGDKHSQFALGTMYLLGDGTAPNALEAYAWYKVAAESGDKDYKQSLAKLDALIPAQHRAAADQLSAAYLEAYGERATNVACRQHAEPGTRITELECHPPIDAQTSFIEAKMCE
jgi:TPR repeat protein